MRVLLDRCSDLERAGESGMCPNMMPGVVGPPPGLRHVPVWLIRCAPGRRGRPLAPPPTARPARLRRPGEGHGADVPPAPSACPCSRARAEEDSDTGTRRPTLPSPNGGMLP